MSGDRNLQILENRLELLRKRRHELERDVAVLTAQAHELRAHEAFGSEQELVDELLKAYPGEWRPSERAALKRSIAFCLGLVTFWLLEMLVSRLVG